MIVMVPRAARCLMAAHMGGRAADGFVNKLGTLDTHENLGEPLIMEASQLFGYPQQRLAAQGDSARPQVRKISHSPFHLFTYSTLGSIHRSDANLTKKLLQQQNIYRTLVEIIQIAFIKWPNVGEHTQARFLNSKGRHISVYFTGRVVLVIGCTATEQLLEASHEQ